MEDFAVKTNPGPRCSKWRLGGLRRYTASYIPVVASSSLPITTRMAMPAIATLPTSSRISGPFSSNGQYALYYEVRNEPRTVRIVKPLK